MIKLRSQDCSTRDNDRRQQCPADAIGQRRFAAFSSVFRYLIDYGGAARNPAREVAGPAINRQEGATLAFSEGAGAEAARVMRCIGSPIAKIGADRRCYGIAWRITSVRRTRFG